jgi:hypothetical protein
VVDGERPLKFPLYPDKAKTHRGDGRESVGLFDIRYQNEINNLYLLFMFGRRRG